MVYQPVPDTAEVRFELVGVPGTGLAGASAMWRWFVRDEVIPWTPALLTGLAGFSTTWWDAGKDGGPDGRSAFDGAWALARCVATDLTQEGGVSVSVEPGLAQPSPGTRTGASLPAGVAALVQFTYDGGGSPKRGRTFLPAGVEEDLDGLLFTTTLTNLCTDLVEDFINGLGDAVATWAFVGVSRYSGSEEVTVKRATRRAGNAVTNTLASHATRRQYASQRDRRPDPS